MLSAVAVSGDDLASELQLSEGLVQRFLDADPELQQLWDQLCRVREQLQER